MIRWPWSRRDTTSRDELARARQRLARDRARLAHTSIASRRAAARLEDAAAAEQAEIRKNHLGELLHDALMTPGRHP